MAHAVRPSIPKRAWPQLAWTYFVRIKRHLLPVLTVALLGAACSPVVDIRGQQPEPQQLAQVKVGVSTEEQVQALLGTPSTSTTWGEQVWHYVYERTVTRSFFDPEVTDYRVVTIAFDDQGKVTKISKLGPNALKPVDAVTRVTPTPGREMTIIEQLLGNVGKFTGAGSSGGPGGGG